MVELESGGNHTVFLKSDGTAWAVGSNSHGQLGVGSISYSFNPVNLNKSDGSSLSGVVEVSLGIHSLSIFWITVRCSEEEVINLGNLEMEQLTMVIFSFR